jgi:hypothetical protein
MRLLIALVLGAVAATAQQSPDVVLHQTFETDTAGWAAFGQGAAVHVTNHALALTYEVRPKQIAAAFLSVSAAFARLQQLRFRVKSDHDTALGVILSEKQPGGGNYNAWFWAPANTWQDIELAPADFVASDGPTDPVDADGKLDTDSLQGIGIVDIAQLFAGAPDNPEFPVVIDRASGAHTILVEDFQVLGTPRQHPAAGVIDTFDRGFLQWVTLGGMELKLSTADNPLGKRALQAKYQQVEGQFELLTRRLSNFDLSKAASLAFDIASEQESTMVISLELKQGGRYNLTIYPPGRREVFHVNVKLADFEGPGKLDPAQLKSLTIADITSANGGAPATNTIWIGKVETLSN